MSSKEALSMEVLSSIEWYVLQYFTGVHVSAALYLYI